MENVLEPSLDHQLMTQAKDARQMLDGHIITAGRRLVGGAALTSLSDRDEEHLDDVTGNAGGINSVPEALRL